MTALEREIRDNLVAQTFILRDFSADDLLCYIGNGKAQQLRLDRPSSSTKRHLESTQG